MILYLLLAAVFLLLAFLAPIKVTMLFLLAYAASAFVVKVVARMVSGNDPSFGEALKAVFVAGLLQSIAAAIVLKLTGNSLGGMASLLAAVAAFTGFAFGLVLMLDTTFKQSAVISLVCTVISSVFAFGAVKTFA